MAPKQNKKIDPLFQLFEHYLLNRSYEDAAKFTREVAEEYLTYLDSTFAHVPFHVRKNLLEDLEVETHEMLVKKMYGCVRPADYVNSGNVIKVAKNLNVFDFQPPVLTEEAKDKKE